MWRLLVLSACVFVAVVAVLLMSPRVDAQMQRPPKFDETVLCCIRGSISQLSITECKRRGGEVVYDRSECKRGR